MGEELQKSQQRVADLRIELLDKDKTHAAAVQMWADEKDKMQEKIDALSAELDELKLWKEAQEMRKARVFRPLKSGGKSKVAAPMAEKLDHAQLKTRLKSTGKKLWAESNY